MERERRCGDKLICWARRDSSYQSDSAPPLGFRESSWMALMRSNSSRRGWKSFQMARKGPLTFLARCGLLSLPPFPSNSDQCANTFLIKGITFFGGSAFSHSLRVYFLPVMYKMLYHMYVLRTKKIGPKQRKLKEVEWFSVPAKKKYTSFFCFYLRTLFFF